MSSEKLNERNIQALAAALETANEKIANNKQMIDQLNASVQTLHNELMQTKQHMAVMFAQRGSGPTT